MIGKIFDGEILVRTLLTRLLILCKTILGTQVIVTSIIDPGDRSSMHGLRSWATLFSQN